MSQQWISYCRSLKELLERVERIEHLYQELVEPIMNYPRHRETLASQAGHSTCYHECLLVEYLRSKILDRRVCIIGPLGYSGRVECDVIGAPEGAVPLLVEKGLKPLYVTGDLDVDMKYVDLTLNTAEILIVHIHGDNIERIALYARRLKESKVIYTSQVPTSNCVLPIGGFTDGDRAIIIPMLLEAREVKVLGYNFVEPVFTHKSVILDLDVKRVKLRLADSISRRASELLGYKLSFDEEGTLKFLKAGI